MSADSDKDRTFSIDVGSAAADSLQTAVFTKLTEFMGDCTDEILAQYIVVLVAHGKHKAQAVKDLEAFLGDHSEEFVSWLWNYLCTYMQTSSSKVGNCNTRKLKGKCTLKEVHETPLNHECEAQISRRAAISNEVDLLDWNGHPATEDNLEHKRDGAANDERNHKGHQASKQHHMPHHAQHDEENEMSDEHHKRHRSPPRVNATRRLLQSAVRDAVAPAVVNTRSGVKRLRSVVSTEIDSADTLEDTSEKQTFKVVGINDIRHAELVASQASRITDGDDGKNSITERGHLRGSVWDRLGKITDDRVHTFDSRKNYHFVTENKSKKLAVSSVSSDSNRIKRRITGIQEKIITPIRKQKCYKGGQTTTVASTTECQYHMDLGSSSRCFAETEDSQYLVTEDEANQNKDDSITVKYKLAEDMDQDLATEKANLPQSGQRPCHHEKFLNISVNLNASQSFETSNEKGFCRSQTINQESSALTSQGLHAEAAIRQDYPSDCHQDIMALKNKIERVQLEMLKLRTNRTQGTDKTCKVQDASNRPTVFVTNIHFAASKDAVMAHFAQCGDVANVIMLMDGATGLPKGAAYIEFYMQSAADKALSLNDTSFYSRILKVVQKTDTAENSIVRSKAVVLQIPSRGKTCRGMFPKFTRYGNPVKLQWRRETVTAAGTSQDNGGKPTAMARSYVRSFSYIRNK